MATNLWCKCPLSALKIAFIDFPFITLLIIAHIVSNMGNPKTINGNTITAIVYVLATPSIDIIDNENPKKFELLIFQKIKEECTKKQCPSLVDLL